jgi:hypothetical protein
MISARVTIQILMAGAWKDLATVSRADGEKFMEQSARLQCSYRLVDA